MSKTLMIALLVFECGTFGMAAQERPWSGAFEKECARRYLMAFEARPQDAVGWVSAKARYYGLREDLIGRVASEIAGKHSNEVFRWAKEVLDQPSPDAVEHVFALAVMGARDPGLLEPSTSSTELLEIKDPLDRVRASVAGAPALTRAARTYSRTAGLAQTLYDFLKNGNMSWPAKLQLPEEEARLCRVGLQRKLTQAELDRVRNSIAAAEGSKDAGAEVMGRRVLFHQTANLDILTDGVEKGGKVAQGLLRSLGELSQLPEATGFLLHTAREYEFARVEAVGGMDIHFEIVQALGRHDAAQVTDYLAAVLVNPNQYHTPACLGSISWALHTRKSSRNAKQALGDFWGSRVALFIQMAEWTDEE
jgi:hypothetical protein